MKAKKIVVNFSKGRKKIPLKRYHIKNTWISNKPIIFYYTYEKYIVRKINRINYLFDDAIGIFSSRFT